MLLWEMLQHKPRSSVSNGLNIALLCGGSFIWSRNNEERFFLSQLTIIEAIGKKFIVFRINDFRICFRRENGLSGQWFFPVSMSFLKTYPRESEVMTVLIFHTMYTAHTGNNSNKARVSNPWYRWFDLRICVYQVTPRQYAHVW